MLNPALLEVLEAVAVAVIGSSVVAPLAATLRRIVSGAERIVSVKLPSGVEVRLELDRSLSQEQVSDLITSAVRSAQEGDQAAVRRAVDASHDASREARDAVSS